MPERFVRRIGKDLLIEVEGGASHIGCAVMAVPYQKDGKTHATLSVLNRPSHKDDAVASLYAKAVCEQENCCVVCICGIHYDNISPEQIAAVMDWAKSDVRVLLEELKEQNGKEHPYG